jgi:hypothetical protein
LNLTNSTIGSFSYILIECVASVQCRIIHSAKCRSHCVHECSCMGIRRMSLDNGISEGLRTLQRESMDTI